MSSASRSRPGLYKLSRRGMMLGAAGLVAPRSRVFAAPDGYAGPLLVIVQASGGWDVTSYCDPKVNVPGEQPINHWPEESDGPGQAGNINFASFPNNNWFFPRYHQDMLVINGVDAQTNSHSTGVLHNWSGRNARGFPSLSAMFAAQHAPSLPLSYVNFGGFGDTANLIRFSRLDDVGALRQILTPELNPVDPAHSDRMSDDMSRIRAFRLARIQRARNRVDLHARERDNLDAYAEALESKSQLSGFANFVPASSEVLPNVTVGNQTSNMPRQIQLTIAAFEAGVASAADLFLRGFDTHQQHDTRHEPMLDHLNTSLDLLWTLAREKGFADRLTVVVGSDFGRTPRYNADEGKDHWPIGSVLVMQDAPTVGRSPGWRD